MTFDNAVEVQKIQAIFPDAHLVLRILPENHAQASSDLGMAKETHETTNDRFAVILPSFRNQVWCNFLRVR